MNRRRVLTGLSWRLLSCAPGEEPVTSPPEILAGFALSGVGLDVSNARGVRVTTRAVTGQNAPG